MAYKTLTIFVEGMTCSACEARIEKALLALPGAVRAKARRMGGSVFFEYEEGLASPEAAKAAIEKAGYQVREKRGAGTAIALGAGLLLAAAYLLASSAGLFSALPKVDASLGYGMLFVVGLLTSLHCVAMCGGIALSQSLSAPSGGAKDSAGRPARLLPGLLYNAGRLISYSLIGGAVGALGSAFSFSPAVKGAIAGAAGLFMVYLGLKMLGVLPSLPASKLRLPAGISRAIGRLRAFAAGRGPFAVGLLNGLMPCGPLQTMQLYALGTGSFLAGALSMFVFALGTLPLMLGFGLMAALLPRKTLPALLKAGAVLVIVLGAVTLARAANLAGVSLPGLAAGRGSSALALIRPGIGPASGGGSEGSSSGGADGGIVATLGKGSQSVVTGFKDGQYLPFTVQAGVPLKWIIRVSDSDLNGCNNPLTVPAYGISKTLAPGDNLVEFTPKAPGSITYTCWMGMVSSRITVVSSLADAKAGGTGAPVPPESAPLSLAAAGGCCGNSAARDPGFEDGRVPTETLGIPVVKDGVQVLTIRVDGKGYSPAAAVLQKGMKAVIRFQAAALDSCNYAVVFPEYQGSLDLSKGQLETPELTVSGDFGFQCGMGMLHGYVKAVDDLAAADKEKIKREIAAYRPAAGAGSVGCCSR